MSKKWLVITLLLTIFIGSLRSAPVLASKGDWSVTWLEKISLYRSEKNYGFSSMVDSIISLSTSHFLLPSDLVQSHHSEIQQLASELTKGLHGDEEKSKAIYTWVVSNIVYDTKAYFQNPENPRYYSALETLRTKVALCSGYAHLNAALHRAIGIEAKVVYGQGHAWNEIKVNDKWLQQDPTYGSGGLDMENQLFVPQFKEQYFSSVELIREGEFPW